MKKIIAALVIVFGASMSLFAHADMTSSSDNGQQATQPQPGDQQNPQPDSAQQGSTSGSNSSDSSSSQAAPQS